VLPVSHRLRRSTEFAEVVRTGTRARRGCLVLHQLSPGRPEDSSETDPAQVGLIVGRSVGGSVTRHQVSRRLRAQLAARLDRLPDGSRTVVRALPEAASATSDRLGADLDAALDRLADRPGRLESVR
jgi:ribonuclease P protein component